VPAGFAPAVPACVDGLVVPAGAGACDGLPDACAQPVPSRATATASAPDVEMCLMDWVWGMASWPEQPSAGFRGPNICFVPSSRHGIYNHRTFKSSREFLNRDLGRGLHLSAGARSSIAPRQRRQPPEFRRGQGHRRHGASPFRMAPRPSHRFHRAA
jgi:hypothetical protein